MENEKDLVLLSYIEKIERLNEEATNISADIKEVYKQAVDSGYDRKAIAELIRIRKQDPDEVAARNEIIDLYAQKIGMEL